MYNIEKEIQKAMDQMTMYMDEKASAGIEQRKNPLLIILWRRPKQHNRTERRAVEYCTVYLNQCWANGHNTCVSITCMRNVYN
jgi:hypothetical protein